MREVGKKKMTRVETVTVRRHAADVSVTSSIGSGPGGAGRPVGVVVKISNRLGVQTDAVITVRTARTYPSPDCPPETRDRSWLPVSD